MAKKARGRRSGGLAGLTTADLHAELTRRQSQLDSLQTKREKLAADLADLDAEIAALGGAVIAGVAKRGRGRPKGSGRGPGRPAGRGAGRPAGRAARAASEDGRKRPRNDQNLSDALVAVLSGKTMGVSEVAEAVQKAGYKTSSDNFRTIVNQTLLKDDRIKKVARGQYTAK